MPSPGGRQEDEEDGVVAEPALYEGLGSIFAIDAAVMVTKTSLSLNPPAK